MQSSDLSLFISLSLHKNLHSNADRLGSSINTSAKVLLHNMKVSAAVQFVDSPETKQSSEEPRLPFREERQTH